MRNQLKKINYKYILVLLIGIIIGGACFGTYRVFSSQKVSKKEIQKSNITTPKNTDKENEDVSEESNVASEVEKAPVELEENTQSPNSSIQQSENSHSPQISAERRGTEEEVISYFSEQEQLVDRASKTGNSSLIESMQQGFTTLGNFLFQGGTIKGYTFSELSTKAKLQVLKIALTIDYKIDSFFPNYKGRIKSSFLNLKSKAIAKYLEITAKICESHSDTCYQARSDFKNMKDSFGFTLSMLKGVISEGGSVIKEWYHSIQS